MGSAAPDGGALWNGRRRLTAAPWGSVRRVPDPEAFDARAGAIRVIFRRRLAAAPSRGIQRVGAYPSAIA